MNNASLCIHLQCTLIQDKLRSSDVSRYYHLFHSSTLVSQIVKSYTNWSEILNLLWVTISWKRSYINTADYEIIDLSTNLFLSYNKFKTFQSLTIRIKIDLKYKFVSKLQVSDLFESLKSHMENH